MHPQLQPQAIKEKSHEFILILPIEIQDLGPQGGFACYFHLLDLKSVSPLFQMEYPTSQQHG